VSTAYDIKINKKLVENLSEKLLYHVATSSQVLVCSDLWFSLL